MISLNVARRLLIWLLEIASQAILVGWVIVALLLPQQIREAPPFHPITVREIVGIFLVSPLAVLMMFFTSCYLVTTIVSRAVWPFHNGWSYSIVAVLLFLIHFEVANVLLGGAFEPSVRTPLLFTGLCIAFFTRPWEVARCRSGKELENSPKRTKAGQFARLPF